MVSKQKIGSVLLKILQAVCVKEKDRVCVSITVALVWAHPGRPMGSWAGFRLARPG